MFSIIEEQTFDSIWLSKVVPYSQYEENKNKRYDQVCEEGVLGGKLQRVIHPISDFPTKGVTASGIYDWKDGFVTFENRSQIDHTMTISAEMFVKQSNWVELLKKVQDFASSLSQNTQYARFQLLKADDLPFSPAQGEDVVSLELTWSNLYLQNAWYYQKLIEEMLIEEFDYLRVHPGKFFVLGDDQFKSIYDKDIKKLDQLLDQSFSKSPFSFENCFTDTHLY